MTSCGDDDKGIKVPGAFNEALLAKFPQAHDIEWEYKSGYRVAEFKIGRVETEAWYNTDAGWEMTVRDAGKDASALPVAVAGALADSEYSSWHIDDIDYYERIKDAFYVIEVEKHGLTDTDLYFSPDGAMLKAVPHTGTDILPTDKI